MIDGHRAPDYYRERMLMVDHQLRSRGIKDERVLQAMGKVPRHHFVPAESHTSAYGDGPLPIGEGQTISQPYMVALMTECLSLKGDEKVLEIGTGSGYQTAVLMELAREVCTVERIPVLAERARQKLVELGYDNFCLKVGDGSGGWPEQAPFDGIIVTAGAPSIPETLLHQLSEGGKLVIPVGSRFSQRLLICTKRGGQYIHEENTMCVFVPLVGKCGWEHE